MSTPHVAPHRCALAARPSPPLASLGGMAAAAVVYPPQLLADLAVQLLAEASCGGFTPATALGGWQAGTRGTTRAQGCCTGTNFDELNAMEGNPFYFGRDTDGYTLVNVRRSAACNGWPHKRGRPLPVRLARWLLAAGTGTVVRHRCDNRACLRLDLGTQADNLGDAIRRGRRRPRGPASRRQPARGAHGHAMLAAEGGEAARRLSTGTAARPGELPHIPSCACALRAQRAAPRPLTSSFTLSDSR